MRCANNLKQFGVAIHAFHNDAGQLPYGGRIRNRLTDGLNHVSWNEEQGGWLVQTLPYMEQGALYNRFAPYIKDNNGNPNDQNGLCGTPPSHCRIQRAFTDRVRGADPENSYEYWLTTWKPTIAEYNSIQSPGYMRCPSYNHDYENFAAATYAGSVGPQCINGPCGFDPYMPYCDHPRFPRSQYTSQVVSTDTNAAVKSYHDQFGNSINPAAIRGLFNRGGARITFKHIKDGMSNTIMVGEFSPGESNNEAPDVKYTNASGHWISTGGAYGMASTLAPLNYRTDRQQRCNPDIYEVGFVEPLVYVLREQPAPSDPDQDLVRRSWQNWHLAWAFKSHHPGGVNFVFADGSVHFLSEDMDHWLYQFLGCRYDGIHIEEIP